MTTVLAPADYADIQNLVALYCITTDNADADAFMRLWVEPTEFGGYDSGAFGKMDTWQAMYEFEKHHVGPGGMANGKRHQSTNIVIEGVSATEALVTNDMLVFEVADVPFLMASGRYNKSVVVKTAAGWKFKRRTLDIDSGFFKLMEKVQAKDSA
ncbi:MAG: nuclear transport factor 2 family protein [Rhodoferax sp.]|nr:nuclear transport factor 2 family protein [Rhodoferax sp.]